MATSSTRFTSAWLSMPSPRRKLPAARNARFWPCAGCVSAAGTRPGGARRAQGCAGAERASSLPIPLKQLSCSGQSMHLMHLHILPAASSQAHHLGAAVPRRLALPGSWSGGGGWCRRCSATTSAALLLHVRLWCHMHHPLVQAQLWIEKEGALSTPAGPVRPLVAAAACTIGCEGQMLEQTTDRD